ncbi:hypothetical protein DV515_00016435, partial [Chloebia gouldiae]
MIPGRRENADLGFGILLPTKISISKLWSRNPFPSPGAPSDVGQPRLRFLFQLRPLGIPGGKDSPASPAAGTGDNVLPGGATSWPPLAIPIRLSFHPWAPPGATMSFLGSATSRVTSWDTSRSHHVLSKCCHIQCHLLGHLQVPPVLPWQCHTWCWLLGHLQVPPRSFSSSATSRVTSWDTSRCHHVQVLPHPGSHPWSPAGATMSFPSAATSRVTSWDTSRVTSWDTSECHHVLPWQCHILGHLQVPPRPFSSIVTPVLSHPGLALGTPPGATTSLPKDLGGSRSSPRSRQDPLGLRG